MSVEQVGPGGVSNSYGVRVTNVKQEYSNDTSYKDVFIPEGTKPLVVTTSPDGVIELDGTGRQAARRAVPKSLDKIRTVLIGGHSLQQWGDSWSQVDIYNLVNDGSGSVEWLWSNHGFATGMPIRIVNSSDPYWSAPKTAIRVNSARLAFDLDPRAAPVLNDTIRAGLGASLIGLTSHAAPNRGGVFHVLNAMLGQPWTVVGHIAANGKPPEHMILDFEREILSMSEYPDAIWLEAGANSYRVLKNTIPVAVAATIQYYEMLLERGIALMVQEWPPNDPRDAMYAAGAGKAALRFNKAIRDWARGRSGVYFFPTWDAIAEPTVVTAAAKANVMATDGVHFTSVAGMLSAKRAYDTYKNVLPVNKWRLPYSLADSTANDASSTNRFSNPLFGKTTGGAVSSGGSGTVPNRVTISVTGSATVQGAAGGTNFFIARNTTDDGDAFGNNVAVRCNFTASDENVYIDIAGDLNGFVVGKELVVGAHVRTELVSGNRPKIIMGRNKPTQGGSVYDLPFLGDTKSPAVLPLPYDTDEVMVSAPFPITDVISATVMRIQITAVAAGVIDVFIGRPMFESEY